MLLREAQEEALARQRDNASSTESAQSRTKQLPRKMSAGFENTTKFDRQPSFQGSRRIAGKLPGGYDAVLDLADESAIVASSPLSSGWQTARDSDGTEFYFNSKTGESRWDSPPVHNGGFSGEVNSNVLLLQWSPDSQRSGETPDKTDASSPKAAEANDIPAATESVVAGVEGGLIANGTTTTPIPDGWEAVAAEDGAMFYHHIASGVTQWELPQRKLAEGVLSTVVDKLVWEEFATDDGVPFWYNATTGTSSWLPPEIQAE